jgi:hypothetical protein
MHIFREGLGIDSPVCFSADDIDFCYVFSNVYECVASVLCDLRVYG